MQSAAAPEPTPEATPVQVTTGPDQAAAATALAAEPAAPPPPIVHLGQIDAEVHQSSGAAAPERMHTSPAPSVPAPAAAELSSAAPPEPTQLSASYEQLPQSRSLAEALEQDAGVVLGRPALLVTEAALHAAQTESLGGPTDGQGLGQASTAMQVDEDDSFYELTPEDLQMMARSADARRKVRAAWLWGALQPEEDDGVRCYRAGGVSRAQDQGDEGRGGASERGGEQGARS
jgi:hypothetical protein